MAPKKTQPKRAALYIRVSTREQAIEGYSLDAQTRTLTDYCQQRHYQITGIYRDEGISAKDIKHRPGMIQLLEDAKSKQFDVILVWKLTRFSRNIANLTAVCEELDHIGVSLISYSEAFDSVTPAGRMVRSMLGTVAQFEREVIGENVKMGMLERARQGKRTCSEILGYDTDGKDTFKINKVEAEYVRFAFEMYLQRKNLSGVAELCRQRGYHGKRGKVPTAYTIQVIITRPQYCGYNVYCGQVFKGNHPPIVSVDTYNKVQTLLGKQGRLSGRQRIYSLTRISEGGQ